MTCAVLSGKGGTGKTFISVNLASLSGGVYIDCDVEEPNGHLYFKPKVYHEEEVMVKIPEVNQQLCDGCRQCVDFCRFNALAYISEKLMVFSDICHSCGGCVLACPHNALSEKARGVGKIRIGYSGKTKILSGFLNIGELSGVPIIKKLLASGIDGNNVLIDCPPGTSCLVMESIKNADYCVIVGEPTLFGLHNLRRVYELVRLFNKKAGVVINKAFDSDDIIEQFCRDEGIKVLCRIPYDSRLNELNSEGEIAVNKQKNYYELFVSLAEEIRKEGENATIAHT